MKALKRVLALCLAAMLLLAMCPMAFADESTEKIIISNARNGETYTAYRIFQAIVSADGDNVSYVVTPAWENFFTQEAVKAIVELDANNQPVWKQKSGDTLTGADALAKLAKTYAAGISTASGIGDHKVEQIASNGKCEFTLPLGYYFVNTTSGTLCNLYSAHAAGETGVNIIDKNQEHTIEKKIKDVDSLVDENTAAIGDTVNFESKITIKPGATNFVYHDKMDLGLTYGNTVTVKSGETDLTGKYDLGNSITDGCTFEVKFKEDYLQTITADTVVTISYSAVVNENAVIYQNANKNAAHLTYGNSGKTEDNETKTYTFDFNINKVNNSNEKLADAHFRLYKNEACTDEVKLSKVTEGEVYRVNASETDEIVTIKGKTVQVKGLNIGTYYLKETQQPKGYNLLNSPVKITISKGDTEGTYQFAYEVDGTTTDGKEVTVLNQSGTTLPSTGGMGTTVFYIVGGILMAGAVVLLVSKKRMERDT